MYLPQSIDNHPTGQVGKDSQNLYVSSAEDGAW